MAKIKQTFKSLKNVGGGKSGISKQTPCDVSYATGDRVLIPVKYPNIKYGCILQLDIFVSSAQSDVFPHTTAVSPTTQSEVWASSQVSSENQK